MLFYEHVKMFYEHVKPNQLPGWHASKTVHINLVGPVRDFEGCNFQGNGSPFLLRRCQGPEHPKILQKKKTFLCHNFCQAMSKWLLGDFKLAKMSSRRCQTQYYEEPRSWDPRVSACMWVVVNKLKPLYPWESLSTSSIRRDMADRQE